MLPYPWGRGSDEAAWAMREPHLILVEERRQV